MSLKDWIAPGRAALLLIDCQVDFAEPDGALGRQGIDMTAPQRAVHQAAGLADAARAVGVACVFVRLITRDDDLFLSEWTARRGTDSPALCRQGSRGAEFAGPQPRGAELVFSKPRYNGFDGTGLDATLKGLGIDTLVMAGLTTECCIAATALDAFARDFHVFVVSDATACYEPELQAASLKALGLNCALLVQAADLHAVWNIK